MIKITVLFKLIPVYVFLIILIIWTKNNLHNSSYSVNIQDTIIEEENISYDYPDKLLIEKENKSIAIIDGVYSLTDDSWNVSDDFVQFANNSQIPNEKYGATVIYGHNTPELFGTLSQLKKGDLVNIYTKNNKIYTYAYSNYKLVSPENTEIFNYSGSPMLVLITCSGLNDQYRKLYFFDLNITT